MSQALPALRYDPPANFYRSASTAPEQYESQDVNAGMQFYPFRALRGDFQQTFRQGLLRDMIDPQFRETNVATQPTFAPANIPGADAALVAQFYENVAGLPKPHMRVAVFARGAVASSAEARASAAAVSGLFMGTKPKYMPDLQKSVGYGRFVTASHWYLFSGDGRVHRGYDDPALPGGDVRRFDYEAARRSDPDNSGSYAVRGNQLILEMGTQGTERIVVPLDAKRLVINTVIYYRR